MKKRIIENTFGVIFNCLATCAVHIDLATDYSSEKFLMVLERFVSIRGFPSKLSSDNDPQLVDGNELKMYLRVGTKRNSKHLVR